MKYILIIIFLIPTICFGQGTSIKLPKDSLAIAQAKKDSVARMLNTPVLSINELAAFVSWLNNYNPDKGRNAVIIAELERIIGEAQKRKQNK